MENNTVLEFASELKMPAEVLLEQLNKAGLKKSATSDTLTAADKNSLLEFLRASHGEAQAASNRITLTRKSTSALKAQDATGKTRTVQVEVRKKRVLVKRDTPEAPEAAAAPVATVAVEVPAEPVAPVVQPVVEATVEAVVEAAPGVEVTPEPVVEAAVATVVEEVAAVEAAAEPVPEPEPEVVSKAATEEKPKTKTVVQRSKKSSFLDDKELAARQAEEDRYAQLRARQEQDRLERENREKELQRLREEAAAKQAALKVAEESRKAASTAAQTAPDDRREGSRDGKEREDRDGRRGG